MGIRDGCLSTADSGCQVITQDMSHQASRRDKSTKASKLFQGLALCIAAGPIPRIRISLIWGILASHTVMGILYDAIRMNCQ